MHLVLNKRVVRERLLAMVSRPNPAPVFIFGNQKSGTSAVAGLLAAATGLSLITDFAGAQEPFIGDLIAGRTSIDAYIARNAWAFSAALVKEPGLSFVAPALLDRFAQSRSVFLLRDPYQNIRSILERVDLRGDREHIVPGKRRINRTWRSILAGRDLGLPPAPYVEILATRWLRAVQIAEQLGGRTKILRYEEFNAGKRETINELASSLGLPVVSDISGQVDHQFQPRGRGTDPKTFFGPNYARISLICGAKAKEHGYPA
ncbi:MAG TPA: hypothetical protein VLT91_07360 [Rhizomicrobium sp.]|nr:hypothetical protein [Rhizomicrobium sp.]